MPAIRQTAAGMRRIAAQAARERLRLLATVARSGTMVVMNGCVRRKRCCLTVLSAVLLTCTCLRADDAAARAEALHFFEGKVRPVLAENCFKCHGPDKQKGKLRLDSREAILRGGDSGPAIVPGEPAESLLVKAIHYEVLEMPPERRLSNTVIGDITRWVALGAPWPSSTKNRPSAELAEREKFSISEEDRAYWAFQEIGPSRLPAVSDPSWVANPIDAFVLARLEAKRLAPNPPASPRNLIRRLFFDLIGLPPTPAEVAAFVANPSTAAYEALIDELLSRPQYGERWGRHWLDVVRFAQTNGYERDDEKPFAWRYRDYVIRSFNDDKPFDRFIVEQLAGDELEEFDADAIVATGFYRLGVWDDEPDDKRAAEYDGLDDIVSTTGQAFLGLTMGCARCHNHMFDPVPQEDYYRFLSFFHNIRYYDKPKYESDSPTYAPLASFRQLDDWRQERDRKALAIEERLHALPQADEEGRKKLNGELDGVRKSKPPFEWALAVREHGRQPRPTHVLIRGNAAQHGDEVQPAFLEVLGGAAAEARELPTEFPSSGRRRALAEWIASQSNPLTARVIANRIWQHHFGRGIVRTPNDFGRAGVPPTHPKLLDWLAHAFVKDGWRLKSLHKRILMSSTYRMSSRNNNEMALAVDPSNELFWRQNLRRLDAEAIRDATLSVSGTLNLEMGGRGIFPTLSGETVAGASRPGRGWEVMPPEEQRRRSVYVFVKRTMKVPLLETFDYSNTDQPLGVRPVTTVAPQALMLLNSEFMQAQAAAFAKRLVDAVGDDRDRQIELAYQLALARRPTSAEKRLANELLSREEAFRISNPPELTFKMTAPKALENDYRKRLGLRGFFVGPNDRWSYHRGVWKDKGDSISWTSIEQGPHAFWEGDVFTDGELQTRVRLHPNSEFGSLILRGNSDGDGFKGYELALDPVENRISIRRHQNGWKDLGSTPYLLRPGDDHVVRFVCHGPRVQVYMDENETAAIDVEDSAPLLEAGQFGVRTWGSPITLRDCTLKSGDDSRRLDIAPPGKAEEAKRGALRAFALVLFNLNEFVYVD